MNQVPAHDTFTRSQGKMLHRLFEYIERHGDSLDRILRQARADSEASESRALHDLAEDAASKHDRARLAGRLHAIANELLCALGEPLFEVAEAHMGSDFDGGLCWHAARLTELHNELSFALGA